MKLHMGVNVFGRNWDVIKKVLLSKRDADAIRQRYMELYKDADANRPGDGLIALEIATYKADNAFMNAEASFRNCYAFLMSNLSGLTTAEQRSLENEVTALSVAISEAEDLDESGAVTESGAPSSAPPGPDCPDEKNANCRCDIAKRKPLPAHCRGFMPWHH